MKVLIIEDEKLAQDKLERLLKQIDTTIFIKEKLETVSQSIKWLSINSVDLIFMDIHLADGSAFNIFNSIKVTTPIIFTTAYDEYAIQAFRVNSIDYLLKPIAVDDLINALEKFNTLRITFPDISNLITQYSQLKPINQERFLIQKGEQLISINADSIAYFFADGKYVFLVDNIGNQYIVDYTMEKLCNMIDTKKFFRINRKYLINIDSIEKMFVWFKSRIKIKLKFSNDNDIVVSNEKTREFKEWLNQ